MIDYLLSSEVNLTRLKNNLQHTWRQHAKANGQKGRLLSQRAAAKALGMSQPAFSRSLSPAAMTDRCIVFILAFAKMVGREPDELLPELGAIRAGGRHG